MPEYISDRADRVSEYIKYMSKHTSWHVMVGITRCKVISFFLVFFPIFREGRPNTFEWQASEQIAPFAHSQGQPCKLVTLGDCFFFLFIEDIDPRYILHILTCLASQLDAERTFPVDPRRTLCQGFRGCVECALQGPESYEKSGGAAGAVFCYPRESDLDASSRHCLAASLLSFSSSDKIYDKIVLGNMDM